MDSGTPQAPLALSGAARASRWAIVLAGGQGCRMEPLIREYLGQSIPKQYCTFMGTRSMLQHTLDRAGAIVPPEQIITIIGKGQRDLFDSAVDCDPPGQIIEQPFDRGTASAVYLALTQIMERDPLATVLILPASHFIFPEERFVGYAIDATILAQRHPKNVILIGANAERSETECGWIQPDKREWSRFWCNPGSVAMEVLSFRESPSEAEAALMYRWGWLINTMIVSARAETLWNMGWEFLPQMMRQLETFHTVVHAVQNGGIDRSHIGIAISHILRTIQYHDFATSILQQAAHRTRVLPMPDVFWSAWDHPRNISDSLERVGMKNFLQTRDPQSRTSPAAIIDKQARGTARLGDSHLSGNAA